MNEVGPRSKVRTGRENEIEDNGRDGTWVLSSMHAGCRSDLVPSTTRLPNLAEKGLMPFVSGRRAVANVAGMRAERIQ